MAENTQTEDEPSIEEILDSIRQIISEDDDEEVETSEDDPAEEPASEEEPMDQSAIDDMDFDTPAPEPEPEEKSEAAPEPDEGPLDQSAIDDIDFDTPIDDGDEENKEEKAEEDVLELTERVDETPEEPEEKGEPETAPEPEPEPVEEPAKEEPKEPEPAPTTDDGPDSILTEQAETAALAAMSELARKTAVEYNGITLEDIVRSELKPLLRAWLDKNLPTVIERLVREELERVSKRVLDE